MIVKNFEGVGTEIDGVEQFRISWSYISLPNGSEIGPKDFAIPDNLITEEFVLGWNITTNTPIYGTAGNIVLNPIAWYTDTFFLEYYFIDSDLNPKAPSLRVPDSYDNSSQSITIKKDTLFRANGKNFPGQPNLTNKATISNYPGLTTATGMTPTQDSSRPQVYEALTDYFMTELLKHEYKVRNSWETTYGPQSGSQFSLNLFGLDRSDYEFLSGLFNKDCVISTLPTNNVIPSNNIYITSYANNLIASLNDLDNFKYGIVQTPADLGIEIIDFSKGLKSNIRPQSIYNANGLQGTVLTHVCNSGAQLTIQLTADRYEPTIELTSPILASQFKRGFTYKYSLTQTVFPVGFISLSPTTGKYPYNNVRPYNIKPHSFGTFGGKNTRSTAEFFFKLFRLRMGGSYDQTNNVITTGPDDFNQLLISNLPTLIVESTSNNNAIAEAVIGNTNNEVYIKLPFDYARGKKEWQLAHSICKAFLQNYTIGYHEFVADYSAADEPVFSIGIIDALAIQVISVTTSGLVAFEEGTLPTVASPAIFVFERALSNASSLPLTVTFTISGTATIGTDFYLDSNATMLSSNQYQITFVSNQLSLQLNVFSNPDVTVESDETVIFSLDSDPAVIINTLAATATWTILDDDALYLAINGGTFIRDFNNNLIEITN